MTKPRGPRSQSFARRLLQHLADDGGRYVIQVIAEDMSEDKDRVMFAVIGLAHRGLVDVERKRPRGSLYQISDQGLQWLAEKDAA